MLRNTVFVILCLTVTRKAEEHGDFFKFEENSFSLGGDPVWNGNVDSLLSCSHLCARLKDCKGGNFKEDDGTCVLFKGQTINTEMLLKREGYFYLEKVGYWYFIMAL